MCEFSSGYFLLFGLDDKSGGNKKGNNIENISKELKLKLKNKSN